MKHLSRMLLTLLLTASPCAAIAEVRISIGLPAVYIDLGVRGYPTLEVVPGYPVYYAPNLRSNFFFYDGMYWVFDEDDWYTSTWYDGPWDRVDRYDVPVFVLRIPVRYYRNPPRDFRGWRADAPPRWSEHWGREWQRRRGGWQRWNHKSPARSPRPDYQRKYAGDHYPTGATRQQIEVRNYRYQPRDAVVLRHRDLQRSPRQNTRIDSPSQQPNRPRAPQGDDRRQDEGHWDSGEKDGGNGHGGNGKREEGGKSNRGEHRANGRDGDDNKHGRSGHQ